MQTYTAIIIGSGFGGMTAALKLKRLGIDDFLILERRPFAGGTWCQNTYPGAAVDVPSTLYSLSTEHFPWKQKLADQSELHVYTEQVMTKHHLHAKTQLGATVSKVQWQEQDQCWQVDTEECGSFRARFLINASGPLSHAKIPDFPGRDTFKGKAFHTNEWDHSYDLRNKRVAVIGSGASAAQVIPAIVDQVKQLHVFQRTPHWVMPRHDKTYSSFERWLMGFPWIYKVVRAAVYWKLETRVIGFKYSKVLLNLVARRKALAHLHKQVPDPAMRQQLTPDFDIGCKRIILSDTFYPALTRAHTTLHPQADGIAEITPTGIRTKRGKQVDLDLIVYGTGYDATDGVVSYPIIGKGGRTVGDLWREFPRAYLGTTLPGFPNLFVMTGPNTGIGHTSAIFVIESQMEYVARCIQRVLKQGKQSIEVLPEAENNYTTMIHSEMEKTVWKSGGCHSWYQSKSGHVIAMFPGFSFTYWRMATSFKPAHHRLR